MLIILLMSSLPIILTFLLMFLNKIISIKQKQDRDKPSPYECGFNPLTPARLPFSIQFFLIAMIFLIFDIEIILIIPFIPSIILIMNSFYWFITMLIIYSCLMIGLIYEWNEQSIIWLK